MIKVVVFDLLVFFKKIGDQYVVRDKELVLRLRMRFPHLKLIVIDSGLVISGIVFVNSYELIKKQFKHDEILWISNNKQIGSVQFKESDHLYKVVLDHI